MRRWFALLLLCGSFQAMAAIDVYEFESPEQEQRYRHLIEELRCPKCQNQNLAGSDAGVATDLKNRTYELMQQGKSDAEIRNYLIERYGDFITYKPPVRGSTLVLWAGPFVLLFVVAIVIIWRIRRQPSGHPAIMSAEEQARLARLLDDDVSTKG